MVPKEVVCAFTQQQNVLKAPEAEETKITSADRSGSAINLKGRASCEE